VRKEALVRRGVVAIALIGGILAIVGIFLPWKMNTVTKSGWELATLEVKVYPYLAFIGGFLAAIGAVGAFLSRAVYAAKALGALAFMGGFLVVVGGLWALNDLVCKWGYGIYLTILAGFLAIFGTYGAFVPKRKERRRGRRRRRRR
jgi:hypothetical protein